MLPWRRFAVAAAVAVLALAVACPSAWGQKKKKSDDKDAGSVIDLPDPQLLEMRIGEMLAAWQIGDVEMMHRYYADDVTVVSGAYEPPLQGWSNYLRAYQTQRERLQSVRMDRRNTLLQVKGNVAWAVYQWEMRAIADGRPFGARGHTTLAFEKRGGTWLIVHNHTSLVETAQPTDQAPAEQATPPPDEKPR